MTDYLERLKAQFNDRVSFREKRPGIVQFVAPLYHEDGDMLDIFFEPSPEIADKVRICDHGMALMRLSYSYELDTPNKERIFQKILSENQVREEEGNLFIDASPESLYAAVLQFAQTVGKVSNMRLYRREVIHSLFMELLAEIIETRLQRFHPQASHYPIPDHDEYEVDCCFNGGPRPDYLFGVNSVPRARLAVIACLKFQAERLPFRSMMVLENLDFLGKKDEARLLSAADKVFPSLDDFKDNGEKFLEREFTG